MHRCPMKLDGLPPGGPTRGLAQGSTRASASLLLAALERLGAELRTMTDSTGALGVGVLAALDRATAHPEQTLTPARGTLVRTATGVRLLGCDPALAVTGAGADSLATTAGADVWIQGYCRGPGRLEWAGGHAMGRPRLDVFVMGRCPYARRVE